MCRYIETIRIEKGRLRNIAYHDRRMNEVRREVWGVDRSVSLETYIDASPYEERTRCRVTYGRDVESVEFFPYQIRPVHSLQLVRGGQIEYRRKRADRSELNALFACRGEADDVLIVRGGLLTDTSIANIALGDGTDWYTPASPLLEGTQRACLLDAGMIRPLDIHADDLFRFQKIRLFNAMIDFGEIEIDCSAIMPLR
ncbi:MAG: aminotransferase class IV [Bacteroides sp.]|nr:aminotransferase class IV [Bacteroides sp.]